MSLIEESQFEWDKYHIGFAIHACSKSKDRSTKVGAFIVGPYNEPRSAGFNGFPRGVNDHVEGRHLRPEKYLFTEHAERNAIFNAARSGVSVDKCTMYMNFEPCPCADCARAIIQSGIIRLVGPNIKFEGKGRQWEDSIAAGIVMLNEAGIQRITHEFVV